ncbi:alpha-E domain-containing protein [Radiobacillus sp. PE A8.2]|uniref:alpha-E domain-containing protein n=1 Tax=Radiobacillus sp. PE A8.2 TaxID=3380349 RepID=UPI003890BD80
MLSRVADSLYWMTRNIERMENNARLVEVKLISQLENANPIHNINQDWEEVLHISGFHGSFDNLYTRYNDRSVIDFLFFSKDNPSSILNSINIVRENARAIREIIPQELWGNINSFYFNVKNYANYAWEMDQISDFCDMVKKESLLFHGILDGTMLRGDAYLFMDIGKYLERAEKSARILDVLYHKNLYGYPNEEVVAYHHWWSVLQSVSGYEAYIKTYRPLIVDRQVAEFFILNPDFPRSMFYCIQRVREAFLTLEKGEVKEYNQQLAEELEKFELDLKETTIDQIVAVGAHNYLQQFLKRSNMIGNLVTSTYYLGEITIP